MKRLCHNTWEREERRLGWEREEAAEEGRRVTEEGNGGQWEAERAASSPCTSLLYMCRCQREFTGQEADWDGAAWELHSGPIGGGAREGEQWSDREKQKKDEEMWRRKKKGTDRTGRCCARHSQRAVPYSLQQQRHNAPVRWGKLK